MVSGIPTASGYEERIRFSEMEVVDRGANEQGLLVNMPEGNMINGWDVNVAGVRTTSVKRTVRYHQHAVSRRVTPLMRHILTLHRNSSSASNRQANLTSSWAEGMESLSDYTNAYALSSRAKSSPLSQRKTKVQQHRIYLVVGTRMMRRRCHPFLPKTRKIISSMFQTSQVRSVAWWVWVMGGHPRATRTTPLGHLWTSHRPRLYCIERINGSH